MDRFVFPSECAEWAPATNLLSRPWYVKGICNQRGNKGNSAGPKHCRLTVSTPSPESSLICTKQMRKLRISFITQGSEWDYWAAVSRCWASALLLSAHFGSQSSQIDVSALWRMITGRFSGIVSHDQSEFITDWQSLADSVSQIFFKLGLCLTCDLLQISVFLIRRSHLYEYRGLNKKPQNGRLCVVCVYSLE